MSQSPSSFPLVSRRSLETRLGRSSSLPELELSGLLERQSTRARSRKPLASFVPVHANFVDDEGSSSHIGSRSSRFSCCSWVRRSLRVDTSANLFGGQSLQERLSYFRNITNTADGRRLLDESRRKSLGLGNNMAADEIFRMYEGTDLEGKADSVVFVLKLCIALVSYGYCTVDVEYLLQVVCDGLKLSVNRIDVMHGRANACFSTGPLHSLHYSAGIQCDKLMATVRLANHVSCGHADSQSAIMVLDEIMERRYPYGHLIHMFAFECFCVNAAVSLRMGTYYDAMATSLIAPFVIVVVKISAHLAQLTQLVNFMAPLATGIGTSFVWRFAWHAPACHVPVWYLSVLSGWLPGMQLVYGAYEFEFGSIVNGSTRLVHALLHCMALGIGLTVGWQVFGHNLSAPEAGPSGAAASLPPSHECNDMEFKKSVWTLYAGAYNIPLFVLMMIGLNVRLRDMVGPLLVCYFSVLIYGALTFTDLFGLPAVVINVLTVFTAGNFASLNEYITGTPAVVTVLPVIGYLAPGSATLKSIIESIHVTSGNKVDLVYHDLWGHLVLEGVSYAVGLHLANTIWRKINAKRLRVCSQRQFDTFRAGQVRGETHHLEVAQEASGERSV